MLKVTKYLRTLIKKIMKMSFGTLLVFTYYSTSNSEIISIFMVKYFVARKFNNKFSPKKIGCDKVQSSSRVISEI